MEKIVNIYVNVYKINVILKLDVLNEWKLL